jgi:hypothetical protein
MSHGIINVSQPASYPTVSRLLRRLTLVWTADHSGNADGAFVPSQNGEIVRVLSVPGKEAERPQDGYNMALVNRSGCDVLGGRGRGQDGNRLVDFGSLGVVHDPLELQVSGAGPGASGRVVLYVRGNKEILS